MSIFAFISAISLSVLAFELGAALSGGLIRRNQLVGINTGQDHTSPRRTAWYALLVAIWPGRFDPTAAKDVANVVSLLRRAGYPYETPGEFYASAVRTFSMYLAVGGLLAGVMAYLGMGIVGLALAAIFVFLGLRQPYTHLKLLAKRRAGAMRNNMLTGLAMLNSLLASGVGVQEALRRTAGVGGPFCNLLGLLIARMEVDDFSKAIKTTWVHLPDPGDVEANLFLRDVEDFFVNNRPLFSSVQALQEAVHRNLVEVTESRAALVRQRSGLFGILAVVGLLFSIIAPFVELFF
ncbi:MAG: hypothetical protein PVF74_10780 [Anaerolineales bacterium]|jgi:hypothetical protein